MTDRTQQADSLAPGEIFELLATGGTTKKRSAETWLRLTLSMFGEQLTPLRRAFLEKAMLAYGRACVAEARKASVAH
jgi:hypothetical protein